tara:strand:+ start:273 stop:440 length:168 start_codon:yes stop_codon:yes gene_type:complete
MMLEQVFLQDMEDLSVLDRWQVPNDGPWHKADILSVSFDGLTNSYLAAASNGITY